MNGTRAGSALVLCLAVGFGVGCGSQNEVSTGEGPAVTQGVSGALDYDGVGEAKQGMTLELVTGLFGEPAEIDRVAGCELDSEAGDSQVATWNVDEGTITLTFDADDERLVGYSTDSPSLETVDGARVGDSFGELSDTTGGPALEPLDLGVAATPEQGVWFREQDDDSKLTFDIAESEIKRILGGFNPVCE
ncbi:MAG: hypothetical protein H0U42_00435 [Thermoleophilaceae bacterium]|nr:hypothetical protein [Thermoleophilaceae bacterium]